jgi:hypothetical protein
MTDARSIVWVDANGYTTITLVKTSTGAGTIQSDLLALSQADYLEWWESATTVNAVAAPAGGTYRPSSIRAQLTFQCADGTQVALIIPSPSLSIFLADGQTVDITNAGIVTLVGDCVGNLESSTGSLATSLLAGRRI